MKLLPIEVHEMIINGELHSSLMVLLQQGKEPAHGEHYKYTITLPILFRSLIFVKH